MNSAVSPVIRPPTGHRLTILKMKTFLYLLMLVGSAICMPKSTAATDASPPTSADGSISKFSSDIQDLKREVQILDKGLAGTTKTLKEHIESIRWLLIIIFVVILAVSAGINSIGWWWTKKSLDQMESQLSTSVTPLNKTMETISNKFAAASTSDADKTKAAKELASEIKGLTTFTKNNLGNVPNLIDFAKAVEAVLVKRFQSLDNAKPASMITDQQKHALEQIVQFSNRTPELEKRLSLIVNGISNADTRLANLNVVCDKVEKASYAARQSLQETEDRLAPILVEVADKAASLDETAKLLDTQLCQQSENLQSTQAAATRWEEAATHAQEQAERNSVEAQRLAREREALEQKRCDAEAALKAKEAATTKELAERQENQRLRDEGLKHKAEATAKERAADEAKGAEERARNEAKSEREKAEVERKTSEDIKMQIAGRQAALEKQKREVDLAVEEKNKAIARETALREENQKLVQEALKESAKAAQDRKVAMANRLAAEATRDQFLKEKGQVERLIMTMWPDAFAENGPLAETRREIQSEVERERVEAGTLLAALFRFRVLARSVNTIEMPDVLSDLSRCAYRYWKAQGLSQERAAAAAKSWADALTPQIPAPFRIQVPSPGMPKDNTWMNYRPGGPPQLAEAETWAILNERNIAVKKADVV